VLDQRRASEIVDRLDLRALRICPLCHLDLAFAIRNGGSRRAIAGITTSTCFWVWGEIEMELRAQLRRAKMKQEAWAGEALVDLDERGPRSRIVRELVGRVATGMVDEMRREEGMPQPLVLTFRCRDL
jgi:hypothetical protein